MAIVTASLIFGNHGGLYTTSYGVHEAAAVVEGLTGISEAFQTPDIQIAQSRQYLYLEGI